MQPRIWTRGTLFVQQYWLDAEHSVDFALAMLVKTLFMAQKNFAAPRKIAQTSATVTLNTQDTPMINGLNNPKCWADWRKTILTN